MDTQSKNKTQFSASDAAELLQCNGIWYPKGLYQRLLSFQRNFEAKEGDIVLATMPKSGTTWLKALVFSIVNRDIYPVDRSPLLTSNPHQLVPYDVSLEQGSAFNQDESQEFEHIRPRIYATHLPYDELPRSILDDSKCKIVYLSRNPLDQFISLWHFRKHFVEASQALPLEDHFELFFEGKQHFGPFWNHMLRYWDASLKDPESILFLKYEDLKEDMVHNVKKLGQFIGCPFTEDEEEKGKVEEIAQLCSFQSLQNLEVNKTGKIDDNFHIKNSVFFRKGEVGDWVNHISPEMADPRLPGTRYVPVRGTKSGTEFAIYEIRGTLGVYLSGSLKDSKFGDSEQEMLI